MSRRLRVFISSTMKDLEEERRAVFRRLASFNFEPVMAEALSPSGETSWRRIQRVIASCDVMVLVLGERYGWIPKDGPKGDSGLSVTHLEFHEANKLQMPVLPFVKKLGAKARALLATNPRKAADKRVKKELGKRQDFLHEIGDWKGGLFFSEYSRSGELADQVGQAIIDLVCDHYQQVAARSEKATQLPRDVPQVEADQIRPELPPKLVRAVAEKKAVLFAGSGISIPAGLPAAPAFTQALIQLMRQIDPSIRISPSGSEFMGMATDLAATRPRADLNHVVRRLVDPPQGLEPTLAHRIAVRRFNQIFTTNYDPLFEMAAKRARRAPRVIFDELTAGKLPPRAIIKLHGSVRDLNSLLITERDVLMLDRNRPRLWQATLDVLRNKTVIVVGHSLRDPSIVRLFTEAGEQVSGYYVSPGFWRSTPSRMNQWNLHCIESDADHFMQTLEDQLATG